MRRVALTLVCAALVVAACTRTSDGVPAAADELLRSADTVETSAPTKTRGPNSDRAPGVLPAPAPAGAPCVPEVLPAVRVMAEIADPAAPTATVGVPDGWSMSSAPDGARLEGPDGMWASVTIAAADADPEQAFRAYVDDLTAETVMSTVSVLPAEMCGYSGQKLMGVLTGTADDAGTVQYEARILHVPNAGRSYLIAAYVEAPGDTPGFAEAAPVVTGDFEIGLR